MHGKTSPIRHEGKGVFAGLPDGYEATRYHSLVVERPRCRTALEITAWTENADGSFEEIMGLRHREFPVEGVQFHPESILTQHGHALLKKFPWDPGPRCSGLERSRIQRPCRSPRKKPCSAPSSTARSSTTKWSS
jgi:hypothetical protein